MPYKKHFSRDLKNVNIRQKDFNRLHKLKHGSEPFYDTFSRFVFAIDDSVEERAQLENLLRDQIKRWQDRALAAEAKNKSGQKTLDFIQ